MEVHSHTHTSDPDSHRGRKKWTHYLWEFLMLFLAVFCGFLAENQREHYVEIKREKEFMISMGKDLRSDIANFSAMSQGISIINSHIDSIVPILSNYSELDKHATEIYQHEVWLNLYYNHLYTDRTINQLKNSGNFRLIRNKTVSDGIIEYDVFVRNFVIDMQDDLLLIQSRKIEDSGTGIFNSAVFKEWLKEGLIRGFKDLSIKLPPLPYFLSTDKKQIDTYINLLNKYGVYNFWFIQNTQLAVNKAKALDSLINKEYHLK